MHNGSHAAELKLGVTIEKRIDKPFAGWREARSRKTVGQRSAAARNRMAAAFMIGDSGQAMLRLSERAPLARRDFAGPREFQAAARSPRLVPLKSTPGCA